MLLVVVIINMLQKNRDSIFCFLINSRKWRNRFAFFFVQRLFMDGPKLDVCLAGFLIEIRQCVLQPVFAIAFRVVVVFVRVCASAFFAVLVDTIHGRGGAASKLRSSNVSTRSVFQMSNLLVTAT